MLAINTQLSDLIMWNSGKFTWGLGTNDILLWSALLKWPSTCSRNSEIAKENLVFFFFFHPFLCLSFAHLISLLLSLSLSPPFIFSSSLSFSVFFCLFYPTCSFQSSGGVSAGIRESRRLKGPVVLFSEGLRARAECVPAWNPRFSKLEKKPRTGREEEKASPGWAHSAPNPARLRTAFSLNN